MKKLLIGSAGLVFFLAVGLVALPSFIPSSVYKEKIETQLSTEFDRDVRVLGDVKLSVFPLIKANTGRVEIDNPEGFDAPQFASMDGMSARVKLFPLFSKRIEIKSFTLKNPTINLEKKADGAVNWAFGDAEAAPVEEVDAGPFKRDGRYADLDPSIGNFTLENGKVSYVDRAADVSHTLEDVNVNFVLTGLADPLEVEGDFIYNGTAADVDIAMESVRDFLDGKESAVSADLETEFAKLKSSGRFLAGEDIAFNLDLDGDVSSVEKLMGLVPAEVKYADIAQSAKLSGNYNYDGKVLSATGAKISAKGASFDVDFSGDATLSETPVLDGSLKLNASDVVSLAKALELDVKGLDLVKTANVSADLSAQDKGFSAQNVKADVKGDGLNGTFAGTVNFDDAVQAQGNFTGKVDSVPTLVTALELDVPQAAAVQSINLSGAVNYSEARTSVTNLDVSTTGGALTGNYKGTVDYTDAVTAKGTFTAKADSVPALIKLLEMDLPQAAAVETVDLSGAVDYSEARTSVTNLDVSTTGGALTGNYKGTVDYTDAVTAKGNFTAKADSVPSLIKLLEMDLPQAAAVETVDLSGAVDYSEARTALTNLDVRTTDGPVTGSYKGTATLAEDVGFSGDFTAALASLPELSSRTGIEVPYAEAIGVIDVSGRVSGQGETLSIAGLSATLKDGDLNGNYTGDVSLNNGVNLNGRLTADIPSLRKLAVSTGNNSLPPSTDAGRIYEAFSVSGDVKGTPETINFSGAKLAVDDINANGDFVVDMSKAKPFMTGTLALDGLDLNPYMAAYSAQNPTGEIQPWSKEPLNFAALNAVDGDFNLSTPSISTGRLDMGQSNIQAKLRSGVLSVNAPNIALYGGSGRMTAEVNAASSVPTVSLDMGLNNLQAQGFLGAVAGFTNATGMTATDLKIRGQGRTQAEIMKSLDGQGDFKMIDGSISGVDLEALMSGLDQAFANRAIPGGIGASEITKFKDLVGLFNIDNGVASVSQFNMEGFGVAAQGGGSVDIGSQQIDFSLRPRLTGKSASDLASFGIPIRVKGGFGNVSIGLDTDFVGKIVAERARAKASTLIQDQVGGNLGNALGGVLGGQGSTDSGSTGGNLGNALGGLLGGQSSPQPATTPSEQTTTQETPPRASVEDQVKEQGEEVVNDILGGLFGSKKKKNDE